MTPSLEEGVLREYRFRYSLRVGFSYICCLEECRLGRFQGRFQGKETMIGFGSTWMLLLIKRWTRYKRLFPALKVGNGGLKWGSVKMEDVTSTGLCCQPLMYIAGCHHFFIDLYLLSLENKSNLSNLSN